MRYLTIVLICLACLILACAVFPQHAIFGIEPDVLLVCMIIMLFFDKTCVGVLYFSASAFCMDILFARALGFYAFPYAIIGLAVYFIIKRLGSSKIYHLLIIAVSATFVKECLSGFLAILLRYNTSFGYVFLHNTLPLLFINTLITFALVFPMRRLWGAKFMFPQSGNKNDFTL